MVHLVAACMQIPLDSLVLKPDWLLRIIVLLYSSLSLFIKDVYCINNTKVDA